MEAAHIVMVGTSIIRNAARRYGLPQLQSCAQAKPGTPEDEACHPSRSPHLLDPLAEYLNTAPREASAELNAMAPWIEAGGSYLSRIILVSTDTGAGRLAAEALRRHLQPLAREVKVHTVPGLGVEGRFAEALRGLHSLIVNTVRDEKRAGRCVASNLTGGFKPESGVALMATISGGGDAAYYIHESFRKTVVIPLATYVNRRYVESLLSKIKQEAGGSLLRDPDPETRCMAWLLQPLGLAAVEEGVVRLSPELVEMMRGLIPAFNP